MTAIKGQGIGSMRGSTQKIMSLFLDPTIGGQKLRHTREILEGINPHLRRLSTTDETIGKMNNGVVDESIKKNLYKEHALYFVLLVSM